jgi:hypothetical protein
MQPSALYLPHWLRKTRAPLASVRLSNPLQGVLSTPVTASHVNQGTDLLVTLRFGRGVGFMGGIWDVKWIQNNIRYYGAGPGRSWLEYIRCANNMMFTATLSIMKQMCVMFCSCVLFISQLLPFNRTSHLRKCVIKLTFHDKHQTVYRNYQNVKTRTQHTVVTFVSWWLVLEHTSIEDW